MISTRFGFIPGAYPAVVQPAAGSERMQVPVKHPRPMIQSLLRKLPFFIAAIVAVIASGCRNEANSVDFVHENASVTEKVSPASFVDEGRPTHYIPGEDRPNRVAKRAFLKTDPNRAPVELESMLVPVKMVKKGSAIKSEPPLLPLRHTKTRTRRVRKRAIPLSRHQS